MINNLQELYKADFSNLPETVLRDLEATDEVRQLRQDIKTHVSAGSWPQTRSVLLKQLQGLLDIPLKPILIESWKTHQDVEREIQAQQDSGDTALAMVTLEDHEIRSSHMPAVTVKVRDNIHTLRCFIGITLQLKDVSLTLQQGEIREVLSGTARGHGFIQYQNATLLEKDFLDFDLSGNYTTADEPQSPPPLPLGDSQANKKEPEQSTGSPAQPVTTTQADTSRSTKQSSPSLLSSSMIQFLIGISIALIAVFIFWQFK